MNLNKKHIDFLKEYEALCKKYNIGLHGCGCCGSPCLEDFENGHYVDEIENILYNEKGYLEMKFTNHNNLCGTTIKLENLERKFKNGNI